MITSPALTHPAIAAGQFTLNDLRLRSYVTSEKSSNSALAVSGMVLAAVIAIGAFVLLDPLALFSPLPAKPAVPALLPSSEGVKSAAPREIIAAPAVTAAKASDVPAVQTSVVQAPRVSATVVQPVRVPAPVVRQRGSSVPAESRTNATAAAAVPAIKASPVETAAGPALRQTRREKGRANHNKQR